MNTTTLELAMLDKIAHSEYQPANGATPKTFDDTDAVWSRYIIETPEDKGVFSSLMKKGLVRHDGHGKSDNVCWLTVSGFNVWKASKGGA
jgi:hypothetical protein